MPRDTMKLLRHACRDLLMGLTYNGTPVPVGDEKLKYSDRAANLFVTFGTQTESPDNTSDAFITDSSIDIEINHKTGFEASKDAIDDVSNDIMDILMPTPSTDGFAAQSGVLIQCVTRSQAITRNYSLTDTQTYISKIITITCKIVQQFP
jgi:hypothetical protein